jgi:6-pyruvoyltetrahydropterin/6-carboxytetrahydropterin synthase
MGTITRRHPFDTAHRVMNEKVKCFNLHGHRFEVETTFEYDELAAIGYAIDFKEIKRVAFEFIDEFLDHGVMLNPLDKDLINLTEENKWKLWVMGLDNKGDYNPSAENIASELFYIFNRFFRKDLDGIKLVNIRLFETPNCWVDCKEARYEATEDFARSLDLWRKYKGEMNYDCRLDGKEKK